MARAATASGQSSTIPLIRSLDEKSAGLTMTSRAAWYCVTTHMLSADGEQRFLTPRFFVEGIGVLQLLAGERVEAVPNARLGEEGATVLIEDLLWLRAPAVILPPRE